MKKGQKMSAEQREKIRFANLGKKHIFKSEETRLNSIKGLEKVTPWNKGLRGCITPWNKGKKGYSMHSEQFKNDRKLRWTGDKNPNWIEDKTKYKKRERRYDSAYQQWWKQCKDRDKWRCRLHGKDCAGVLAVHHIYRWADFPHLRYEIANGITLCVTHHPRKKKDEESMRDLFNFLVS